MTSEWFSWVIKEHGKECYDVFVREQQQLLWFRMWELGLGGGSNKRQQSVPCGGWKAEKGDDDTQLSYFMRTFKGQQTCCSALSHNRP
jgi:hypothetical protein